MTESDFGRMVDVNQKGSFFVLREAARRVRDGGRIIALSSSITQLRSPTYGSYAATKAAQEMYASVLAKELEGRKISVNAIAPGVVNTTLFTDARRRSRSPALLPALPTYGSASPPTSPTSSRHSAAATAHGSTVRRCS